MGPIQTLADLRSMIRRRLPLIMAILITGFLLSLYLAVSSPRVYESSAVIQISAPAIADPGDDSSLPASRRVQLIEQWLMARRNLLGVIERHGLFADAASLSPNEKVDLLRRSTRIESVSAPGSREGAGAQLAAIVITAQAEEATVAADIANDFADSVLNRDRTGRQARIAEARSFLEGEADRLRAELVTQDRNIADFSARNEGALPASQEFQQAELSRLAEAEALLDRDIMALDRDRLAIEAGTGPADGRPQSLIQQLRNAEAELAQARLSLGASHPEIRRLQAEIANLSQGNTSTFGPAIQRQLDLIATQLGQMETQKDALHRRRDAINLDRQRMPQVARELDGMTRDQQRLQDRFSEASRRLAAVEAQQVLFDANQTEQLVLLEPAVPPEYPALSNRRKTAALGVFASIALALGAALVMELAQPVLRSPGQFARATGIEPLIALPYRPDSSDRVAGGLRAAMLVAMLVAGAAGGAWIMGLLPGIPPPVAAPPAAVSGSR